MSKERGPVCKEEKPSLGKGKNEKWKKKPPRVQPPKAGKKSG